MTRRPTGWRWALRPLAGEAITEADFIQVAAPPAELGPGQVLIETQWLSLDPYLSFGMRGRAAIGDAWAEGHVHGRVIGKVTASRAPNVAAGDVVLGIGHWQAEQVLEAGSLRRLDSDGAPPTTELGVLGVPGLTAWVGLQLGKAAQGETVVVSAVAGPVGSVAAQVARELGCRVIGIAGGAEKNRYALKALRVHACLDHREPDLAGRLARAAPGGVDLVFENVGAPTLDATLPSLNNAARVMLCGLAAHYNDAAPVQLANFRLLLRRHVMMRGFATHEHPDLHQGGRARLERWLQSGDLVYRETISQGLETAPAAFLRMLRGEGLGKHLVCLSEPD